MGKDIMITTRLFCRFFHLAYQRPSYAAQKSLLATLRQKTGYTFTNCKKALEMHQNDLNQAEKWLKEQAQSLGWTKATKLEGRQTTQGLIGMYLNKKKNSGVVVEVNCETDFVAKNKQFQKIVEEATVSCFNFVQSQPPVSCGLTKVILSSNQLKNLPGQDGKSLADHVALMIGTVGENALLKRALCYKIQDPNLILSGYTHPSSMPTDSNVYLGRIGGLVALRKVASEMSENSDLHKIAKEICQHVVGLNPRKIGTESDKPSAVKDEETCLIHQDFLLEDGVTVQEILNENGVEVVAIDRFECGENIGDGVESLDNLET